MANIQLFLENQEVELNDKVSFPLNKSFENLWNPTDIIVEHSKSINIPATAVNNIIMANAYRLDRSFFAGESNTNIGMYLNPLKRIPMKLLYNGSILLDGYAKYTSSTINDTKTYYTFNLYGMLGDIFQTLMDCVVDENKLTDEQKAESDGGAKYVIKSEWQEHLIDKDFVAESWSHNTVNLNNEFNPHDNIGMAPAYRGLYEKFETTSALGLNMDLPIAIAPTKQQSVEDQMKSIWVQNLKNKNGYTDEEAKARVDALDYNTIIPKGLNEHQLRQFRSYEQKPYIYFHALLRLYRNKCKELTGYQINLDPKWFSANNPYYANLCYMLDYLSIRGNTINGGGIPFTGYSEQPFTTEYPSANGTDNEFCSVVNYQITDNEIINGSNVVLEPFTIGIQTQLPKNPSYDASKCEIKLMPNTEVLVRVRITVDDKIYDRYYWGGTGTIGVKDEIVNPNPSRYNNNNFIKMHEETKYNAETDSIVGMSYITIPSINFPHTVGQSITVNYSTSLYCKLTGGNWISHRYFYNGTGVLLLGPKANDLDGINFSVKYPNTLYRTNWRNSTTCALKNLYTKNEPLFNVILQYTKMMGLIWKVDYQKRTIDILTKGSYFNDYNIVDWTHKVDKTKGLTIEPVSFNSKYIVFNYENVDGYHYGGYKNKYGVNYGEKKLRTKYNFDTKENKLFKDKIYPSSVSNKSIVSISDLQSWNTISTLPNTPSEVNFIDCEDDNQEKVVNINNWYFRCDNKETTNTYTICDVSPVEITQDKYFWVGNNVARFYNISVETNTLPQFSPVYKSDVNGNYVGCLFTCPNEDYTADNQLVNANNNFIYDICWSDYINERYNANNKKLTCYIRLTPLDFEQFNFKTFVVIDNQLFVVNKITDFNVSNHTTKVELIQVTNINGYTEQRFNFPDITFSASELHIEKTASVPEVRTNIVLKTYPYNDVKWDITPASVILSGTSQCYVEDVEYIGNTIELNIVYESSGQPTEKWQLNITKSGQTYTIPIYINQ